MFSESAYPPSWKPVTSCRNNLIAVCWAHTNQGIDMCTLSLCSGDKQSLQSNNAFFYNCQTSQYFVWLCRNATVVSHSCLIFLMLIFNFPHLFVMITAWSLKFIQSLKSALFYNKVGHHVAFCIQTAYCITLLLTVFTVLWIDPGSHIQECVSKYCKCLFSSVGQSCKEIKSITFLCIYGLRKKG